MHGTRLGGATHAKADCTDAVRRPCPFRSRWGLSRGPAKLPGGALASPTQPRSPLPSSGASPCALARVWRGVIDSAPLAAAARASAHRLAHRYVASRSCGHLPLPQVDARAACRCPHCAPCRCRRRRAVGATAVIASRLGSRGTRGSRHRAQDRSVETAFGPYGWHAEDAAVDGNPARLATGDDQRVAPLAQ